MHTTSRLASNCLTQYKNFFSAIRSFIQLSHSEINHSQCLQNNWTKKQFGCLLPRKKLRHQATLDQAMAKWTAVLELTHRISVRPSYIRLFSYHRLDIELRKVLRCPASNYHII